MSNLSTLKQKVEEMQAEIERLEAEDREPEIPVGTLCWFWDGVNSNVNINTYNGPSALPNDEIRHLSESGYTWMHARIANDIPGVMVWEKHDGGPCPVDGGVMIVTTSKAGTTDVGGSGTFYWQNVTAYAIINKAEWME